MSLPYFICIVVSYEYLFVRLAEIKAARKRSRKFDTFKCKYCHCVMSRGQLCFGRSYTPRLRW